MRLETIDNTNVGAILIATVQIILSETSEK